MRFFRQVQAVNRGTINQVDSSQEMGDLFVQDACFGKSLNLPDIVRVGHQFIEFVCILETQELDKKFDINHATPVLFQVEAVRIFLRQRVAHFFTHGENLFLEHLFVTSAG